MKLDRTGKLLRGKVRRQLRLSTRLWFRYNGLRPATAKPAGSVQVRLGWVGKSGRGGGCGESRTRLTGPPAYPPCSLHAADVKASCTRAGFKFVPSRGEGTRRYSEISWYKGVVLSDPKLRVPAFARFVLVDAHFFVIKHNKWFQVGKEFTTFRWENTIISNLLPFDIISS